ncbi:MAG: MotA/TolQ/ExbB proton channel family protein [Myxococcota bacterium]
MPDRTHSEDVFAHAATNVALAWTGAVAVIVTAVFYLGLVDPLLDTSFGALFGDRGRVPYAITFLSAWAAIILGVKYARLRRERAVLEEDLLPARLGDTITPENTPALLAHLDALPAPARSGVLATRLRRALVHFAGRGDSREVSQQLGARAQADADAVESSYTLVRVFIWAVPILGFIGTVIGIGTAVGGFSESLDAAADLAVMKSALGSVTTGLAVAFDTTLLALVMSILIMFPASAVQKSEEDFLVAVEDYAELQLLSRLASDPLGSEADVAQRVEAAVARAMAAHEAQLRNWGERLGQIGETLSGQVLSGWQKVDELLRVRQGEQLERLDQWAHARQQEASDELSETQRNLLRDFRSHLEGMAAEARRIQELGAARVDDQLAGIERLHRRLQEQQAMAGEAQRVQAQELSGTAEKLARTLGHIRSEASEVRDEGARAFGDFAEQLRDAAREAQAFQRDMASAEESQAHTLHAASERLAATLGRIDEQVGGLERWRQEQVRGVIEADRESALERRSHEERHAALQERQREALGHATHELSETLRSLRSDASAVRGDLGEVADRLGRALSAIEARAGTGTRLSRFFRGS